MWPEYHQEEFAKPSRPTVLFIEEQLEAAYKQGSVKRLSALVGYLSSHELCEDKFLEYLAEAGLKTKHTKAAEWALIQLTEKRPNNEEYWHSLLNVLIQQCHFERALTLIQQLESRTFPSIMGLLPSLSEKNIHYRQLRELVKQYVESAKNIADEEHIQNGEALLAIALEFEDRPSIIEIAKGLATRIRLPDDFVEELCFVLGTPETHDFISEFVAEIAAKGSYPELIKKYLIWMTNRGHKVPNPKQFTRSIKGKQAREDYADVIAVLHALSGDRKEFSKYCYKGMKCPNNIPVLYKYAGIYWLKSGEKKKVESIIDKAEQLDAEQLRFLGSALEFSNDLLSVRLKLLLVASKKFPQHSVILNDLGDAWLKSGEPAKARQCFYNAWRFAEEESYISCINLANTLFLEGDVKQAFDYAKLSFSLQPDELANWQLLSRIMISSKNNGLAYEFLRICISKNPEDLTACFDYASMARHLNLLSESRQVLDFLLNEKKDWAQALNLKSLLEMSCGNVEEATQCCLSVLDKTNTPHDTRYYALSNLLFCANYNPFVDTATLKNWFGKINEFVPEPCFSPVVGNFAPRRVRVGYVSADFKTHPVAYFLEALFKNHNKEHFEIFAYSGVGVEDTLSELLREYVEHWKYVGRSSDSDVASMIVDDGIDILVDLSGHTDGHRLGLFALKPCAVQVSWLGFAQTTGMKTMDYFLGDPILTPPESDDFFSEKPWRLPRASYCYSPRLHWRFGVPRFLPRKKGTPIVFGNLGRAIRFNPPLLELWRNLLIRLPNSILKIDNPNFKDEESQEMMIQRFEKAGIPRDRVWVGYTADYLQSMLAIDIALDGFPQNSGTTLFEFLWCGVPIVTKKDRPSVGRLGAMVLHAIGRDEWIADTPDEYIDIAVKLASNPEQLYQLRHRLREDFIKSELCDGPGFASAVEDAFVGMLEEKSQCQ